jgi:leucyl-tRNA synthetase
LWIFKVVRVLYQAAADKIIREIELFGPDFENYGKEPEESASTDAPSASAAVNKSTKGKIAAKATGHTYQFQIMESIGVPRAEIKKFADPYYWLDYFPPIAVVSLSRRSYIFIFLMSVQIDRSQSSGNAR